MAWLGDLGGEGKKPSKALEFRLGGDLVPRRGGSIWKNSPRRKRIRHLDGKRVT
jgi:hypothetical protein